MRILCACEESQAVCLAFREKGHEAYSCDILPCSGGHPEWHLQGYLEDIIGSGEEWDMIIAFPPCTYICSSGLHWNKRVPERAEKTEYALAFVCMILNRKCPKIVIENPVGCISTRIAYLNGQYTVMPLGWGGKGLKPTQIIQPYNFGEDASKATCLWVKGVPQRRNTSKFSPRIINGKPRWSNQTDSGQNKLGGGMGHIRSKTYPGIAKAMAEQWG